MKTLRLFALLLLAAATNAHAQTNYGGEIVSHSTFGEGMMVTRAKIIPLSGTVTNIFFFNREDEPWNNNVWYEYDWEIRGRSPFSGWSQIRVRAEAGEQLRDAPDDVETTTNLGDELLHYILIRKDNRYVYDIRRDFNASTYDYTRESSHNGNSASLLEDGPRIYNTGGSLDHIPDYKRLDFSLGITAFDNNWAGKLPSGDYDREAEIDFARFYTFSGNNLNDNPQWSDEFNGSSLDFGKWFTANWTFSATQFRPDNVRVQNGRLYLRINRGNSGNSVPVSDNDNNSGGSNNSVENVALNGSASQSTTNHDGVASRAIDGNTNGNFSGNSVTHTAPNTEAWWQVRLSQTTDINQVVIHNRTDNCCTSRLSDYTVAVLNDNGNVIWSQYFPNAPTSSSTINVNQTGRTVRVSLNGTLSLAEVEVLGSGN